MAWVYIAFDKRKGNQCKVGKTKRDPKRRISETENPDYVLFKAWKVPAEQLDEQELLLHKLLAQKYTRLKHKSTGRLSEHFSCTPEEAQAVIHDFLHQTNPTLRKQIDEEKAKIEQEECKKEEHKVRQSLWNSMTTEQRKESLINSIALLSSQI